MGSKDRFPARRGVTASFPRSGPPNICSPPSASRVVRPTRWVPTGPPRSEHRTGGGDRMGSDAGARIGPFYFESPTNGNCGVHSEERVPQIWGQDPLRGEPSAWRRVGSLSINLLRAKRALFERDQSPPPSTIYPAWPNPQGCAVTARTTAGFGRRRDHFIPGRTLRLLCLSPESCGSGRS